MHARKILGIDITRDRKAGTLILSQRGYIDQVLKRFNIIGIKAISTPLALHFQLSSRLCLVLSSEKASMSRVPYSSVLGSLLYAMICRLPNLAYAVSMVSCFIANLEKEH